MLYLVLFSLLYLVGCVQCSENMCETNEGGCFSFKYTTLEDLKEKLKGDKDLRAYLETQLRKEMYNGVENMKLPCTDTVEATTTSRPDTDDKTTAPNGSVTTASQQTTSASTSEQANTETTRELSTSKSYTGMNESQTPATHRTLRTSTSKPTTTISKTEPTSPNQPNTGMNGSQPTASRSTPLRSTSRVPTTISKATNGSNERTSSTPPSDIANVTTEPILTDSVFHECLAATVATKEECGKHCQQGTHWWKIGSLCVCFMRKPATYDDAKSKCTELDGELAARGIRDGTIVNFLDCASKIVSGIKSVKYWIGFKEFDTLEGNWPNGFWTVPSRVHYQPDSNGIERCATLR